MNCPCCGHDKITILEKRGERRRRECERCLNRWTTYEVRAEDLERLQRLERAVGEALGLETVPAPAPEQHEPFITAEELERISTEQRASDKQRTERQRRERLQKAYDEERKARLKDSLS